MKAFLYPISLWKQDSWKKQFFSNQSPTSSQLKSAAKKGKEEEVDTENNWHETWMVSPFFPQEALHGARMYRWQVQSKTDRTVGISLL